MFKDSRSPVKASNFNPLNPDLSFLDSNIKVIGNDIHTSVYDKRDDFGFPIVNFPWLSGDVPRLPSYGIYISQLVRFARCCTSVFDLNSKNLQITSKLLTQGYRYHNLRKTFGKFFRSYSELLSKFGAISFQEYVSKGITHQVFYGDLIYKLTRVKSESNFISSGSRIVKYLRRRQYDPVIIERTIGLVLDPFTALYRSFLKAILQVLIYKALYDKSYLGSKTTMTSGEWTCLISFATAPLTCSERGGSEKFKMKIYVSSGIRTHTPPVHDRKVAAP